MRAFGWSRWKKRSKGNRRKAATGRTSDAARLGGGGRFSGVSHAGTIFLHLEDPETDQPLRANGRGALDPICKLRAFGQAGHIFISAMSMRRSSNSRHPVRLESIDPHLFRPKPGWLLSFLAVGMKKVCPGHARHPAPADFPGARRVMISEPGDWPDALLRPRSADAAVELTPRCAFSRHPSRTPFRRREDIEDWSSLSYRGFPNDRLWPQGRHGAAVS